MIKFREDKELMEIIKRKFKNAKIEIVKTSLKHATFESIAGFTVTDDDFEEWYHENKLVIPKEFKHLKYIDGEFKVLRREIIDNDFYFTKRQNEHIKKLLCGGVDMFKTLGNILGGK